MLIIFFASQCPPLNNNSKITETQFCIANTKVLSVNFESKDISNILRSLDVNKVHGHDNVSIRMLKKCVYAILESLSVTFNSCTDQSMFPDICKKSNIFPIHKKGDKQ